MSAPFQLQQQLPQYIGYEGLAQALGVSPSTVRRKVRRSELPGPKEVSPNRRGWRIDELALRYPDKFGQLVANGVSDPKDLPPDELENQARDLAAQAHAKRTGETIEPRKSSGVMSRWWGIVLFQWHEPSIHIPYPSPGG